MSIVNQKIKILDEDLIELVGAKTLKRKEIMGATGEYLTSEGLLVQSDKRYFTPDDTIKNLLLEIGVKPQKEMLRGTLMKLFGGVARDAGLVDY